MPFSSSEGKGLFREWVLSFQPHRVLDIGAGAGGYADIIRDVHKEYAKWYQGDVIIDAVEIFEPYIERFKLREKYDQVMLNDVRNPFFLASLGSYDLIVMGDVVEHIERNMMIEIWKALKFKAKFIWISLPVKMGSAGPWYAGYNQSPSEGDENAHELHVCDWDYQDLINTLGPFKWQAPFRVVVILMAEGQNVTP